jgi:hypothetical protein
MIEDRLMAPQPCRPEHLDAQGSQVVQEAQVQGASEARMREALSASGLMMKICMLIKMPLI